MYYHASRAGMTRREAAYLPIGKVLDQIAVWQIEELDAKQNRARDVFDI
jgi:hypothetical protein